ncbi:type II toxin-antitoxin system RelE/ParE family toxin [Bulleidia sp. zg-1006]|uniref:type II toxin-antitoxin system RelE/ParE family toxin n=1 Tax=Bulleidia sp. zg-1006 TaxID=2806552 RepID=UPI00193A19C3|nr:type II toxin-antitoxin system RelE/ParE family toxin [Bulleidia sp. zg-1006]QRG86121.1 type II toxin-antitoxin system RelE/ParE family toxin [Bulleidia sp. zg-1006]
MSKTYKVIYSPQALQDLTEIYEYIRFTLQARIAADNQSSRIRKMIRSLDTLPARHSLVEWEPWTSMKIYKVPVDNYMIFYRVDDELTTVSIVRIFYSGRNIEDIIKHTND